MIEDNQLKISVSIGNKLVKHLIILLSFHKKIISSKGDLVLSMAVIAGKLIDFFDCVLDEKNIDKEKFWMSVFEANKEK